MSVLSDSWHFGGGLIDGFFDYANYGASIGFRTGVVIGAACLVLGGLMSGLLPALFFMAVTTSTGALAGGMYGMTYGGFANVQDKTRHAEEKRAIKKLTHSKDNTEIHPSKEAHHHSNVRDNLLRYQAQKRQDGGLYESMGHKKSWVERLEEQAGREEEADFVVARGAA